MKTRLAAFAMLALVGPLFHAQVYTGDFNCYAACPIADLNEVWQDGSKGFFLNGSEIELSSFGGSFGSFGDVSGVDIDGGINSNEGKRDSQFSTMGWKGNSARASFMSAPRRHLIAASLPQGSGQGRHSLQLK